MLLELSILRKLNLPIDYVDALIDCLTIEDDATIKWIATDPIAISNYAIYKLGSRMKHYENIILTDLGSAVYYSISLIKDRWYELEKKLLDININSLTDASYLIDYTKGTYIHNWPECDEFILNSNINEYYLTQYSRAIHQKPDERFIKKIAPDRVDDYIKSFGSIKRQDYL